MRSRNLLPVLFTLFYLASASASVYGTFPYELEQQSDDLSTEIRVGVVNAGDQTLKLDFSSSQSDEYNVSLPGGVKLSPSRIVESPQREGWKYLGNGRYAEIQEYSFDVEISRYRESNRVDIPLQVTASPTGSSEQGASNPVYQVTSYNYTVLLDPRLRPLERETQQEREVQWEDSQGSIPDDWKGDEESSEAEQDSKDYKPNQTEGNTGEREQSGVNTLTMILVTAIIACTGYMIRVI